jgi:hypothetical protein
MRRGFRRELSLTSTADGTGSLHGSPHKHVVWEPTLPVIGAFASASTLSFDELIPWLYFCIRNVLFKNLREATGESRD